jgi:sulfur-carrier protein
VIQSYFLPPEGNVAVEVRLPTLLRQAAEGQASVSLDGATVGEVLHALVSAYPGLGGQVLTEDGSLHRFVNVYLNDDDVRYLEKLDTKVTDTDVLSILPAVAGG